ncbi:Gfo/Idh/MocA family protein [Pseudonocardia spinosispora]|uniref:Gfo/Idh/MocA family protein n=1 Tax=Pseudonocardia spinosispora TaxID=103441 RepID=UPI00048ACFD0|nr:Gfo/Idh/MocA family oxidoreductase [Pseudonocardia spinosispora]
MDMLFVPSGDPRAILIGFAGQQGRENIATVAKYSTVVGGVDTNPAAQQVAAEMGFPFFDRVEAAVAAVDFDVAIVTVPHQVHFEVCEELLRSSKHVIKEKPFAVNENSAQKLVELAVEQQLSIFTLVQRQFSPAFEFAEKNIYRIGRPYWFSYDYHMNLGSPTSGWRANTALASGGVVLDMGYHLVDVISRLFPEPSEVDSTFLYCYEHMRQGRLEDMANIRFRFDVENFAGEMTVSRHSHEKSERLVVHGSGGILTVTPHEAALYSLGGEQLGYAKIGHPKNIMVDQMYKYYFDHLDEPEARSRHLTEQLAAVRLIDRIYDRAVA